MGIVQNRETELQSPCKQQANSSNKAQPNEEIQFDFCEAEGPDLSLFAEIPKVAIDIASGSVVGHRRKKEGMPPSMPYILILWNAWTMKQHQHFTRNSSSLSFIFLGTSLCSSDVASIILAHWYVLS